MCLKINTGEKPFEADSITSKSIGKTRSSGKGKD